jgi:hypothetical protein
MGFWQRGHAEFLRMVTGHLGRFGRKPRNRGRMEAVFTTVTTEVKIFKVFIVFSKKKDAQRRIKEGGCVVT